MIYYIHANSIALDDIQVIAEKIKKDFPENDGDIRLHRFGYPRFSFDSAFGVSVKLEKAPMECSFGDWIE